MEQIIGNGMIGRAFRDSQNLLGSEILFASGVSDSKCTIVKEFRREIMLLQETINYCIKKKFRIIYFSSAGELYGDCVSPKEENSALSPNSDYGLHKLCCEDLIIKSGVSYLIFRVSNVLGPGQNRTQLIAYLFEMARFGKVSLLSDATRDLLDINDLRDLTIAVIKKTEGNEIVNMVSGESVGILTIFNEIQSILGTKAIVNIVEGGVRHSFSNAKLRKMVHTPFRKDYWRIILANYTENYFRVKTDYYSEEN